MLRVEGVSSRAYERIRTMNLRKYISTRRVRPDGEISFNPRKNTLPHDAMRLLEADTLREIEQAYKPVPKRKNKTQNYDGNCVKKSFKGRSRRVVYS